MADVLAKLKKEVNTMLDDFLNFMLFNEMMKEDEEGDADHDEFDEFNDDFEDGEEYDDF